MKAGKDKIDGPGALELVRASSKVVVAKGKQTLVFKVKDGAIEGASEQEVLEAILGRSGTLRAPALRKGKTLYVGFNEGVAAGL